MKHLLLTIILVAMSAMQAFAQTDNRMLDSYNMQCGLKAYQDNDYAKCMEFMDKELEQNPKNGYAMLTKAFVYMTNYQYGQALDLVEKALKFIPKKDRTYTGAALEACGRVKENLGDSIAALSFYERAFKTDNDCSHLFKKCDIYNAQENYDQEKKEIERMMGIDRNSAIVWTYAGRNADNRKQYDEAINDYSYAIKLDPDYSSGYTFRAATYINTGRYKEAGKDAIKAMAINQDMKAYFQFYELADKDLPTLAIQLKAQQAQEPTDSRWSYYLGLVYNYKSKFTDGEKALRKALELAAYEEGDKWLVYKNLANSLYGLGKYHEAAESAQKAIEGDSTDVNSWYRLATARYEMGQTAAATETLTNGIRITPNSDFLYYWRARMYMYSGQLRNALDDINTAVAITGGQDTDYLMQRSEINSKLGKDKESKADRDSVLSLQLALPEEQRDSSNIAYVYVRSGQREKALPIVEKLTKNADDSGDMYDIACLYSLLDDKQQALDWLEKALEHGFCEFVQISNDFDLDNIRDIKRFKELVDEYKSKHQQSVGADATASDLTYEEHTTEVPFVRDAGVCKVKCTINGLPLHFYFDTGASDVTISDIEAQFMLKNDYLKPSDIKGSSLYGTADGNIAEGTVIVLRKVDFGGLEFTDVKASVVHSQKAPLLLGQSVLSRLGKIVIDNDKHVLKITGRRAVKADDRK